MEKRKEQGDNSVSHPSTGDNFNYRERFPKDSSSWHGSTADEKGDDLPENSEKFV